MNYEEAYQEAKIAIQKRFIENVLKTVSNSLIDRCNTWYFNNNLMKANCIAGGELAINAHFSEENVVFNVAYKGFKKDIVLKSHDDYDASLEILSYVLELFENPNSGIYSLSAYKTAPPRPSSKHIYSKLK